MGLDLRAACAILEEVNRSGRQRQRRACADVRHGHAAAPRREAQKQAYLPAIASGELRLQAFGVTEPDAGTDTTQITTFAERRGDTT